MGMGAEEQISFAREQLERVITAFGALHPEAIQARLHLGIVLRQTGYGQLAVDEFALAARDAVAALGPVHPDALIARYHALITLTESGRPHEAASELEDLLRDHLEVFGPRHVGTFSVRSALANVLIAVGRIEEADEQLEVLLDEVDASGIELEPGQRASWLLQRSSARQEPAQFAEAMELAREAKGAAEDPRSGSTALRVAAQARVLDALALAVTPHRDGLSEDALRSLLDEVQRELEELREDLRSASGDPDLTEGSTSWVSARLAELAGAALVEDPEVVLGAMRSFVDELTMLRGLDTVTLTAASRLGELLGECGHMEDAVAFLDGVVATVEDAGLGGTALGLVLRNNLGQWMANAGRLEDAVRVLRTAVDDAMTSPDARARDHETLLENLIDRASMLGDLATTQYAVDLLKGSGDAGAVADGVVPRAGIDAPPDRSMQSLAGGRTARAIELLEAGSSPQPADTVAEAVVACARLGRPVLIERHQDGWCWALAAPSIEDLRATLRSLEPEADDLPPFVLASAWVVRDGLTSWRPRSDAPRPTEWWVLPAAELTTPDLVLRTIGGAA
jgi:tetratricopeptide (TPR) repeat protein